MKQKRKILLLIFIFAIILVGLIIIVNNKKNKSIENNNNSSGQNIAVATPSELDNLKQMSEKGRITFYFNKYIENIENGNLQTAYDMLYDEFKNTYFKTIDDFKIYVEEKYPDIIAVNYKDFKNQGMYYVMTLEFQDILNDSSFTQMFVLREYDYNNFVLSFQAE